MHQINLCVPDQIQAHSSFVARSDDAARADRLVSLRASHRTKSLLVEAAMRARIRASVDALHQQGIICEIEGRKETHHERQLYTRPCCHRGGFRSRF